MAELGGFQRRGSRVWLVAHPHSQIMQRAAAAGIPTRSCTFDRRIFPMELMRLALWLRREQIQIVNTHSSRDAWLLGLAARMARVPLVIRTRHIDVRDARFNKHKFTLLADHVLTTSQKITEHLRQTFFLPEHDVTTLPTGIDVDLFRPAGTRAELPPPLRQGPGAPPVIGMVSVLRSWKGHALFFDAIRRLREAGRDFQYIVVGGGVPVENYQNIALRHGVADCVQFTGQREDVPDVLRALDVLCIPSYRHEGIPQIGIQALACGTAVVGSDCGGIPEIILDGQTGRIFPSGDTAALAACIAAAVDEPGRTRQMIVAGQALVRGQHSLEHMLDQLGDLYARHLGARVS